MGSKNASSVLHCPPQNIILETCGEKPSSPIVGRLAREPRQMASLSVGWVESGQGGREVDVWGHFSRWGDLAARKMEKKLMKMEKKRKRKKMQSSFCEFQLHFSWKNLHWPIGFKPPHNSALLQTVWTCKGLFGAHFSRLYANIKLDILSSFSRKMCNVVMKHY